jgi:chromosome segregation ATPase
LTTKRKRDAGPRDETRKKPKRTAGELAIVDKVSSLVVRLEDVEQDLTAGKEKARSLEKKIDALEEGRKALRAGLKATEGPNCDQDRTVAAAQGRVHSLERKLERRDLAIAIVDNVIKLPKLPFEK